MVRVYGIAILAQDHHCPLSSLSSFSIMNGFFLLPPGLWETGRLEEEWAETWWRLAGALEPLQLPARLQGTPGLNHWSG